MSNKVNYLISFVSFVIISISFFLLIKGGDYKNYIIFILAAFSFILGYFIRKRNDSFPDEDIPENVLKKQEILSIDQTKVPQEFLIEQERFKKLPNEIKEKNLNNDKS